MTNKTSIGNRYEFIAGHFLPKVPEGHKCRRPHGHNYEMEIVVEGIVHDDGFIIDFYDLDSMVKPLLDKLDHQMLNEIEGLDNPTAENIASWFYVRLAPLFEPFTATLRSVKIWETKSCWALSRYSVT